jgi:AcrR family transcriptional regulator
MPLPYKNESQVEERSSMSLPALDNGPEARRERQRQEARRSILDATEVLLVEAGGDAFSIRGLAQRCGYSAPTIYHYFGDKDGLIDALLEERFATLLEALEGVDRSPDPAENLRRMALAFMTFGHGHPTFYRLISTLSRKGQMRTPPAVEIARERMQEPITQLAAEGRLELPMETASQVLWALTHGLTSLRSLRPEHEWAADLESSAVDALLRGVVREPRADRRFQS